MYIPSPPLLPPHIAHCSAAPRLCSCTECCHLIPASPQPQACAMPPALQRAQCPLPTNQKVVLNARSLPTKGHAQCLLPTSWSHQMPTAHQPKGYAQCLLPTNWSRPMPAAHQPNVVPHACCPPKVVPHACCPPSNGCLRPPIDHTQCLLPTNQRICPTLQPKGCAQKPAVPPTNQKVVPSAGCPPSKTCPMLTAHQNKSLGPTACCSLAYRSTTMLCPMPSAVQTVPVQGLLPHITRLCPLHAAQGHIHCMLLRAVSNTCCPTTAYGLYPMPAAPQSQSCQCIPLPLLGCLRPVLATPQPQHSHGCIQLHNHKVAPHCKATSYMCIHKFTLNAHTQCTAP